MPPPSSWYPLPSIPCTLLPPTPRPPPPRTRSRTRAARRAGPLQGEAPSLECSRPRPRSPRRRERSGVEVSVRGGGGPGGEGRAEASPCAGPVRSRCGGWASLHPTQAAGRSRGAHAPAPWARSVVRFWVHVPSPGPGTT